MPSFLTHLRSLGRIKSASRPIQSTSELPTHSADVPPIAPKSPDASVLPQTPDFSLDSKIHPDLNALFALIEDDSSSLHHEEVGRRGLKPRQPTRPVKKRGVAGGTTDGEAEDGKGKARADNKFEGTTTSGDDVPPTSLTYRSQKAWSTFGREGKRIIPDLRSMKVFGRTRKTTQETSDGTDAGASTQTRPSKDSTVATLSNTNSRPSTAYTGTQRTSSTTGRAPIPSRPTTGVSTSSRGPTVPASKAPSRRSSGALSSSGSRTASAPNAGLSWSPPAEAPPHLSPSETSLPNEPVVPPNTPPEDFGSSTPGTFGYPTPLQPPLSTPASPALPSASTCLSPVTPSKDDAPQSSCSRGGSFRYRLDASAAFSPLASTFGRAFVRQKDRPTASRAFADSTDERAKRKRTRSRPEVSRAHRRRQSAVWNAEAASAGVVAGRSGDFGWPADVSREILKLTLGVEAEVQAQELPGAQNTTLRNRTLSAPLILRNTDMGVSHEFCQPSSRSGQMKMGAQGRLSPHSFSFPFPSLSTTSVSALPTGPSDAPESSWRGSEVSYRNKLRTHDRNFGRQSGALDDKGLAAVDSGEESSGNAEGPMIQHIRTDSENQIRWESRQLQDYLATSGGDRESVKNGLQPSPAIKPGASTSTYETAASSSMLSPPSLSIIAPTPQGSPGRSRQDSPSQDDVEDGLPVPTASTPQQTEKAKGKRKAEESEDGSPPSSKGGRKTTFAAPEGGRGPPRVSDSSHAPSSFLSQKSRKRVRLSSPMGTPDHSRPGSSSANPAFNSLSSRTSSRSAIIKSQPHTPTSMPSHASPPPRPASRASRAVSVSASSTGAGRLPKRRSLSQSSIPISAIVSPRAPSISNRSTFHMRDPRRPPPKRRVGWGLRMKGPENEGSPFHAWAFWFGFFLPMLWWAGSFWRIPRTRVVGTDTEKAIPVDDPQVEKEARTWRLRCRVASVAFFFTYFPVIVLLAIFVPRS